MGLCRKRTGNYDDMKSYYEQAVRLGHGTAAYRLGRYYRVHEKDYIKMEEYLDKGVKLGCILAMLEFGKYYHKTKDDINEEKYYLMTAEHGSLMGKIKIADFYTNHKDPVKAKYWMDQFWA